MRPSGGWRGCSGAVSWVGRLASGPLATAPGPARRVEPPSGLVVRSSGWTVFY